MTVNLTGKKPELLEEALTCAMAVIIEERNRMQDRGLAECAEILTWKHQQMNELRYEIAKALGRD